MAKRFQVCWDRIARAGVHRGTMAAAWTAFLDGQPYEPNVFVDDDGTGYISIAQAAPVPKVIALELGEYLYQMRATLDACVYEAACENTGQRPPPNEDRLEFPLCETADGFVNSQRKIASLTQRQRDLIAMVQPCNAAPNLSPAEIPFSFNRGLGILNDWARKDRHRRLHVAASWVSNISPLVVCPPGTTLVDLSVAGNALLRGDEEGGSEIEVATFRIVKWQLGMTLKANPNLFLDLAIAEEPLPCGDQDTLATRLDCIQHAVAHIVLRMSE